MGKLVKGVGPKDAKIVIVGEAPGKNEAKRGKPFIGRSGKLLTKLLSKAGILRGACYITNVIKERPPGNNIKKFIDLSRKSPKVTDKARTYISSLQSELTKVQPNVIVAVGNVPLWVLTGNKGITKWRGSVIETKLGRKCVPIIHPAAALRQYIYRYYIQMDLGRVKDQMSTPGMPKLDKKYLLEPTLEEVFTYLKNAHTSGKPVAFDIEVTGREVSCISFSYSPQHAISIPFIKSGTNYFLPEEEKEVWLRIGALLEDEDVEKIAHNGTFDSTFLYRKYGIKTRPLHDTMIAQGLLFPDFRKGLGYVTTQYTMIPYYKDELKTSLRSGSSRRFWLYNAKDSIVLSEALPQQLQALEDRQNLETYEHQRRLIEPLLFITEHGMNLDVEGMERKAVDLTNEIYELEAEIAEEAGQSLNPRSPKQLKDYFYGELGIKPYKSRSTGKPTTNEKALKRLKRRKDTGRVAELILEVRRLSKLRGTLNMDLDKDGRLRSSLNPIGTTTGRLSSSQTIFGTGTNIQNLPPDVKEFIIPDEGYTMYEVDLGQAENRIVAYIAPSPKMVEAFEEGLDIHSLTASMIFEMEMKEIMQKSKRYKSGDKSSDLFANIGQGDKTYRAWGKQANHAFNYGMGYKKAGLNWEIPEKEARFIYNQYHRAYPGVKNMHHWIDQELKGNRTVENLFGRRRQFLDRWGQIQKEAYAFIPQSTVADIINRFGVRGIYEDQETFSDVELLSQVHDSVWFQIPLSLGWEQHAFLLRQIQNLMQPRLEHNGKHFTIPAEVTILPKNARYGYEFPGTPTADDLEQAYHKVLDDYAEQDESNQEGNSGAEELSSNEGQTSRFFSTY